MMLPQAQVIHRTATRIRIRFPALKGDGGFFAQLKERLAQCQQVSSVQVNPLTGSVLILHGGEVQAIARYAEECSLFTLPTDGTSGEPLTEVTLATYRSIDAQIKRLSGGELDLPQAAYLAFIGTGIYQLARGRFEGPPWHTAFWYAMHVFLRIKEKKA